MQSRKDAIENISHIQDVSSQKPIQTNATEKQKQFTVNAGASPAESFKYASKD